MGVVIVGAAILSAFAVLVGVASSIMTIHSYFEAHRSQNLKRPPTTVSLWFIASMFILAIILGSVSYFVGRAPTAISELSPTATNPTPSATITHVTATLSPSTQPTISTPNFLYQADFSQGSQGWLDNNHPLQWSYSASDKALESDGSLPCCNPVSELANVVLIAPYNTANVRDYVIEAHIRITGLNQKHPFSINQPPFFGLYARGDNVNGQGYMAGIGWIYSTPNGQIGANGPLSYLIGLGPNPAFYNDLTKGAEKYGLDTSWHTYRFEVRGNTFMLKVDNKPVYSHIINDNLFSKGLQVGLENYNCLLQVQSFTVYPLTSTS